MRQSGKDVGSGVRQPQFASPSLNFLISGMGLRRISSVLGKTLRDMTRAEHALSTRAAAVVVGGNLQRPSFLRR